MQTFKRSIYCGQVTQDFLDKEIFLAGWVNKRRDHGGIIFIDLRDKTGLIQLVINPDLNPKAAELAKDIGKVHEILENGAKRAREHAHAKLLEIKKVIGVVA